MHRSRSFCHRPLCFVSETPEAFRTPTASVLYSEFALLQTHYPSWTPDIIKAMPRRERNYWIAFAEWLQEKRQMKGVR